MSIFLKVWGEELAPKLFCLRDLQTTVGLSDSGQVTFGDFAVPLFIFHAFGSSYWIKNQSHTGKLDGLSFDEIVVEPSRIFRLEADNFQSICAITSTEAEIYARAKICSDSRLLKPPSFRISYELAGTIKSYLLPKGSEVSLGSSDSDGIFLPFEGIAPSHLRLLAGDTLMIFPFAGSLIYNGTPISLPIELSQNSTIVIAPIGLRLNVQSEFDISKVLIDKIIHHGEHN